jgi:hypothetical protein
LADTANPKVAPNSHDTLNDRGASPVHPAWQRLMRYCRELGHGEIEKLKIQDGVPMIAEVTTRKIKFSS